MGPISLILATCNLTQSVWAVANTEEHTIAVYGATKQEFLVGKDPRNLVYHDEENYLIVSNSSENTLSLIDLKSSRVHHSSPFFQDPRGMVLDKEDGYVYVVNKECNEVSQVALPQLEIQDRYPTGKGPRNIAFDATAKTLYVTNNSADTISVIHPTYNIQIPVLKEPYGIYFHPQNGYVYVTSIGENAVCVVSPEKQCILHRFPVDRHPTHLVADAERNLLYVCCMDDHTVVACDLTTGQIIKRVPVDLSPFCLSMCPEKNCLGVLCHESNSVNWVDLETFQIQQKTPTGKGPHGFLFLYQKPEIDHSRPSSKKESVMAAIFNYMNGSNPMSQPSPADPHRLVESVHITPELVQSALEQFGLETRDSIEIAEEGRIATNLILSTTTSGRVMLRLYPSGCQDTKLETGWVDFEIEALHHLSQKGISVPSPLLTKSGQPSGNFHGITFFAYCLLPGDSLKQAELNPKTASEAGAFLLRMLQAAETYVSQGPKPLPEGDIAYLLKIHDKLVQRFPLLQNNPHLAKLVTYAQNPQIQRSLENTPKGIVHADFFFENILFDSSTKRYSAIDFGDAYYGHIVMDVVIGSMEFSILEKGELDLPCFQAFLTPLASWLSKNQISFDLFYDLLLVNCLRFAIYTLPTTLAEQNAIPMNPYISRFNYFLNNSELKNNLRQTYQKLVPNA